MYEEVSHSLILPFISVIATNYMSLLAFIIAIPWQNIAHTQIVSGVDTILIEIAVRYRSTSGHLACYWVFVYL